MSKHQDDQGLGDYAQGEDFPKDGASPIWRVSAPSRLTFHCSELPLCLMPTLEGDSPHHFLARCLKIRQPGLVVLSWGGGVPKESVNPCLGTRRPDFNYVILTFRARHPCLKCALPPLPLGCLNVRDGLRAWCPRPEKISVSLLLRCLTTMVASSFLNEPRHFLLAFLYIVRKENSRQCMLKLIFTWVTSLKTPREGKRVSP